MANGTLLDRELNKFDSDGNVKVKVQGSVNYEVRIDMVSSTLIYKGWAIPGALTAAAAWRIQKIEKTGNVWSKVFADGNDNFDNVWDNRASLF